MTTVRRDVADVRATATVEQLQALLVRYPRERRRLPVAEGLDAFSRVHELEPDGVMATALLLCTDGRWDGESKALILGIERTGLVTDDMLDDLAEVLLREDHVAVSVPVAWVDESLDDPGALARSAPQFTALRRTAPPLWRWAAARIACRGGARAVDRLLADVDRFEQRRAVQLLAGLVDATASYSDAEADPILERALLSTSGVVRLAALERVADRRGEQAALSIAEADRSAAVRAWAERRRRQPEATLFDL